MKVMIKTRKEPCNMKITILCVGKIKEKYFKEGIAEYQKRLSKYCNFEIIEVADEKTPDHASASEEELIKEKEAQRIQKYMKKDSYTITLEIEGKMLSSEDLAKKIDNLGISGKSSITFIIGGSLGLHQSITSQSDFKLSFSKFTFPHQMMRMILTEQIYRSYRIIHGEPYHK